MQPSRSAIFATVVWIFFAAPCANAQTKKTNTSHKKHKSAHVHHVKRSNTPSSKKTTVQSEIAVPVAAAAPNNGLPLSDAEISNIIVNGSDYVLYYGSGHPFLGESFTITQANVVEKGSLQKVTYDNGGAISSENYYPVRVSIWMKNKNDEAVHLTAEEFWITTDAYGKGLVRHPNSEQVSGNSFHIHWKE